MNKFVSWCVENKLSKGSAANTISEFIPNTDVKSVFGTYIVKITAFVDCMKVFVEV